jgi:hypothetical protein
MIKFTPILKPEEAIKFQNRVVENVLMVHAMNPAYGKIKQWRGATEEEYFIIMFVQGVLVISLSEREMLLGSNITRYAMTDFLSGALKTFEKSDLAGITSVASSYNQHVFPLDEKEITFDDVMTAFKWVAAPKMKVDEDWLSD